MDPESLSKQLLEAEEHVAHGEWLINRQREIVRQLTDGGLDSRDAEEVLRTLETSQTLSIADRDQLRAKLDKGEPAPLVGLEVRC